ncbi:MAG: IreB family regulatory phosphoprotein [Ruminococcaceae bacterium]|nr:IreB family regulatory phosphoprotein [Oscillospiraceae bacterium]
MENKNTLFFKPMPEKGNETRQIICEVYSALKEKGYNPISQLVGYVVSGDPTYITNHKNARVLITKLDRDDLLEEIFKNYLESLENE